MKEKKENKDEYSPLWAERKKALTNRPDNSETQWSAASAESDTRLLALVRFLARSAAEADFNEQVKNDDVVRNDKLDTPERTRP